MPPHAVRWKIVAGSVAAVECSGVGALCEKLANARQPAAISVNRMTLTTFERALVAQVVADGLLRKSWQDNLIYFSQVV